MARLEKILEEQANKEYARMISRVASSYDVETFKLLDTEEFSSIRGQLTAIINITFTMVAVFAAVYHVAQTITGDTGMVNIPTHTITLSHTQRYICLIEFFFTTSNSVSCLL